MAVECPLCAGPTTHAFTTTDRNRGISGPPFLYHRCDWCAVVHLVDVPEDLDRYYPDEYFTLPPAEQLRVQATGHERYRMELVGEFVTDGHIAEIGPGDGLFAVQALDAGLEVTAIDRDAAACDHLRTELGIGAIVSDTPELVLAQMSGLSGVVAWHVLEHVPNPWALLTAASSALRPGGVLVIATPNPAAFGLQALGGRWPHVDAPRHLYLLPHAAVIERGRLGGLEPVMLTSNDAGGLHWNEFSWHFLLRRPGASWARDRAAQLTGRAIATALRRVEERGLRGAAYTLVLRKRSTTG